MQARSLSIPSEMVITNYISPSSCSPQFLHSSTNKGGEGGGGEGAKGVEGRRNASRRGGGGGGGETKHLLRIHGSGQIAHTSRGVALARACSSLPLSLFCLPGDNSSIEINVGPMGFALMDVLQCTT